MEDLGKDNFCTFHQASHSKKTCPQWLHNMTVVVTQLLEDLTTREGEEETNDPEEDDSPPNDDAPSVVLTFEIIRGGEALTAQEAIVGDTLP